VERKKRLLVPGKTVNVFPRADKKGKSKHGNIKEKKEVNDTGNFQVNSW